MIKLVGPVVGFVLLAAPAGGQEDVGCGWCGPAAALGRALALGGPAPCYCPPPTAPRRYPAPVKQAPPPRVEMPLACRDDVNMVVVYDDLHSQGLSEGEAVRQAMSLLSAGKQPGKDIIHQLVLLHLVYTTNGPDRIETILQKVMQMCQTERGKP